MRNTSGLMPPWKPGQSGNPQGKNGKTLRERLLKLDQRAFKAIARALDSKSRAVALNAFKAFMELRLLPAERLAIAEWIVGDRQEPALEVPTIPLEERRKLAAQAAREITQ